MQCDVFGRTDRTSATWLELVSTLLILRPNVCSEGRTSLRFAERPLVWRGEKNRGDRQAV